MHDPRRKDIRMRSWDYSSNCCYHITICTHNRLCTFGDVIEPADLLSPAYVQLSELGACCENVLRSIQDDRSKVRLFNYVVMPNHVHLLVWIRSDVEKPVSLQAFVRYFKSAVTKAAHGIGFAGEIWQKSFYDVIIRDEDMFTSVWKYIDANPSKWSSDEYNLDE